MSPAPLGRERRSPFHHFAILPMPPPQKKIPSEFPQTERANCTADRSGGPSSYCLSLGTRSDRLEVLFGNISLGTPTKNRTFTAPKIPMFNRNFIFIHGRVPASHVSFPGQSRKPEKSEWFQPKKEIYLVVEIPAWKICSSNWIIFSDTGEHKIIWNHQLEKGGGLYYTWKNQVWQDVFQNLPTCWHVGRNSHIHQFFQSLLQVFTPKRSF